MVQHIERLTGSQDSLIPNAEPKNLVMVPLEVLKKEVSFSKH